MCYNDDDDEREIIGCFILFLTALATLSLMMLCTGCSTHRHLEASEVEKEETALVVNGIAIDKKWYEKQICDSTWVNDYLHITVYDTTLPVVESTQKPPVKMEIEQRKEQEKHTETIETEQREVDTDTTRIETHRYERETEIEETRDTKGGIPSCRLILFFAVIAGCLIAAMWGKHLLQDGFWWVVNKIFK